MVPLSIPIFESTSYGSLFSTLLTYKMRRFNLKKFEAISRSHSLSLSHVFFKASAFCSLHSITSVFLLIKTCASQCCWVCFIVYWLGNPSAFVCKNQRAPSFACKRCHRGGLGLVGCDLGVPGDIVMRE